MAMQYDEQKRLGVSRWGFFSSNVFSSSPFRCQISIARHTNYPEKHKSFVGFQVEVLVVHGDTTR